MGEKVDKLDVPKVTGPAGDTGHAFSEAYKTMALPQILKEAKAALQHDGGHANTLDFGQGAALYGDHAAAPGALGPRPGDAAATAVKPTDAHQVRTDGPAPA